MKFITTTILFLIAIITATAQVDLPQGCVAIFDSAYIAELPNPNKQQFGKADSIYFLFRDYICEDGRRAVPGPAAPIGDSTTMIGNLKRNAIDLSRQWVASVVIANSKNEAVIAPVRAMSRTAQSLLNTSLYAAIAAEFTDSLIVGDYRYNPETGAAIDATITKNAQGQYRLRYSSTNKQVIVISDVHIRVLAFSGTKNLDLIRRNNQSPKWFSDTSTLTFVNKKLQALQQAAQATIKNK